MAEAKRVCITGIGAVSAFGRTAAALWAGAQAGVSAVAPITAFDASSLGCRIAAEVRDYAPREDMDAEAAAAMDRRQLFAADAAIQAVIEADVPINAETVTQIGVALGTELPERAVASAAVVARTISAAGPVLHISNGAAGGLAAIGEAAEWIRREDCAIAVAGGAEAPVTAEGVGGFEALSMLSRGNADPAHAARPYDAARDGFVLGEGAAMVVLEDEEQAVRRGAHIFAYIDGYGATFSRAPVAHAAANAIDAGRAMQAALMKWDLTLQGEIGIIFGTAGGGALDAIEGQAIRRVWGPNADKLWVTSIKGTLGHTLGASGALSLVAAVYCLQSGLMPPTANLEQQDPACGDLEIVTGDVRRFHGTKAMVNAFGLGHNASVVVSRP
ncbi:MAG TPA: beta-ketoacyl synthase N-terminal-like domain-containing protein [Dehalococcoidia bacterium]|nr:beta-ketoacyl synthase N-terminal-like domain-containing protein [Dehalococcoidia bacterium]